MKLSDEKKVELVAKITAGFMGELPADANSLMMLTGRAPIPDEKTAKKVRELAEGIEILTRLALRVVETAEKVIEK